MHLTQLAYGLYHHPATKKIYSYLSLFFSFSFSSLLSYSFFLLVPIYQASEKERKGGTLRDKEKRGKEKEKRKEKGQHVGGEYEKKENITIKNGYLSQSDT